MARDLSIIICACTYYSYNIATIYGNQDNIEHVTCPPAHVVVVKHQENGNGIGFAICIMIEKLGN
jgi:hypothetical protein